MENTTLTSNMIALKELLDYARINSPFYQEQLKELGGLADFSLTKYKTLPFTTKEDLAEHNEAFLCVPKKQIAEYVTTSGTTGQPITLYLTANDLRRLAKNERDSLALMGNTSDDLFQLLTTIDKQFMAGLAYYLGVQELGAGMIRIGPGVPHMQWASILNNRPTKLIAVPSFIVSLIAYAQEHGIDMRQTSVEAIVCIGEPIRTDDFELNALGKRISEDWNLPLYSTYASTEMGAAFSECVAQRGCHLNEDLLFLEVLNENGEEAEDGESGEIIVTTLGVEGTPLIRYRTGDIAKVYRTPCCCGRTSPRLGPIIGRKKQMIKFKGTTIYPKAIFEVLEHFREISCYKVLVEKDEVDNDDITVLLDANLENDPVFTTIREMCKARLRVVPKFQFLALDELRGLVYKKDLRKPEKILFNSSK